MSCIVPHWCAPPETLHQLRAPIRSRLTGQRKERDMALNPAFTVCVERKPGAFGDTLNEIRTWLDHCKIQPASFKPVAQVDSGVGFEIGFNSEDEARLFEHAFLASTR